MGWGRQQGRIERPTGGDSRVWPPEVPQPGLKGCYQNSVTSPGLWVGFVSSVNLFRSNRSEHICQTVWVELTITVSDCLNPRLGSSVFAVFLNLFVPQFPHLWLHPQTVVWKMTRDLSIKVAVIIHAQ